MNKSLRPETENKTTQKHAPELYTLTEESNATTKPWFSRVLRHPATNRSGSGTHNTYVLIYLLAPDPQWATGRGE